MAVLSSTARAFSPEKGEEVDKEKYKMLIAEYRKFKRENVRHFRFNAGESTRSFGNFLSYLY